MSGERSMRAPLEERHPSRLDPVLERLAEHHLEMARWGHPDAHAAELALQAANLAEQRLAFDEAVRWFERALESLDLGEARDDELRSKLLIGLARARWTVGDRTGARAPVEEAVALARRMKRGDALASAALVLRARGAPAQDRHPNALALLEEAERALGDADEALRAEVIARTAEHLWFEPDLSARIVPLSEQALQLARASNDQETLANVLESTLFGIWSHLSFRRRRDLTDELTALTRRLAGNRKFRLRSGSKSEYDR
jgi:tetratricopeptide (TPR) repeat protein